MSKRSPGHFLRGLRLRSKRRDDSRNDFVLPGYKNDAAFLSGRSRQLCILEFQAGVINVQTERIGKRRHRLLWSQTRTVMANSRDENDFESPIRDRRKRCQAVRKS